MNNNQKVRVLLIEDDRDYIALVQAQLTLERKLELHCASTLAEGLAALQAGEVDIVVTDLFLPDSQGYDTFTKVFQQAKGVPIIVLTGIDDDGLALRAVADGAQDFLFKVQIQGKMLARSINYALTRSTAERDSLTVQKTQGRILGFIGAKGGVGVSTVALNVAAALAKRGKHTVAVEMRSDFGTFSMYLSRPPSLNLGSLLASSPDEINPQALRASLCEISQNLQILCGPQQQSDYREIEETHATGIIAQLSHMADFLILDIPRYPSPATTAALRQCSVITMVVDREFTSLHSVEPTLKFLEGSGVNIASVGAVLVNRTTLDVPVPISKVISVMGCDLLGVIPPAAQLYALCQEYHSLVVSLRPDDVVSACFGQLADRLMASTVVPVVI